MDAACIRLFARCFAPRMATEPDRLAKATRAESVLRCRHRKPLMTRAQRKGAAACVDNDPLVKRLRIAAFGGFTIFAGNDDRTAAFSARLRRCIAHLVLHGDAVDRRSLAFELWQDVPEARAVANLRRRLHELSAAFASIGCPKALERSPAGVRLAAFIREGCDVRDYLHKKNDPASAARAAAIYAQPIFAGVDDEWLDSARERMRAEHVELLCTLLDRSIAAKDPIAIVEHAEGVARYDPSSEAAIAEAVERCAISASRIARGASSNASKRICAARSTPIQFRSSRASRPGCRSNRPHFSNAVANYAPLQARSTSTRRHARRSTRRPKKSRGVAGRRAAREHVSGRRALSGSLGLRRRTFRTGGARDAAACENGYRERHRRSGLDAPVAFAARQCRWVDRGFRTADRHARCGRPAHGNHSNEPRAAALGG